MSNRKEMISLRAEIERAWIAQPTTYKFYILCVGGITTEFEKVFEGARHEADDYLPEWDESPEDQARAFQQRVIEKGFRKNDTNTVLSPNNIVMVCFKEVNVSNK